MGRAAHLGPLLEVVVLAGGDDFERGWHLGAGHGDLHVQLGEGLDVVQGVSQLLLRLQAPAEAELDNRECKTCTAARAPNSNTQQQC